MKFALPQDNSSLLTRVTARTGTGPSDWSYVTSLDSSFKEVEITPPANVDEADVEVFTESLTQAGEVTAAGATVLKTKERKPVAPPAAPAAPPAQTTTVTYETKDGLLDSVHVEEPAETKTPDAVVEEPKEVIPVIGHTESHLTKADQLHHQ